MAVQRLELGFSVVMRIHCLATSKTEISFLSIKNIMSQIALWTYSTSLSEIRKLQQQTAN